MKRTDTTRAMACLIEEAYIFLLRLPYGSLPRHEADLGLLGRLRDMLAAHDGVDPESVQNDCEARAGAVGEHFRYDPKEYG